jgi:ATP-binding cassette subfamily B protein
MPETTNRSEKKFFVPEVVQTSEMDCGPASLKALLEGYGIYTSYGRLREACQTSVDGTSIDSIEDLAVKLGLDAEQVMLPVDHVLLDDLAALPALVVTRTPSGLTHFVVAWSQHYGWVQLMDPGVGRRWVRRESFMADIFRHSFPVAAGAWREWAGSEGFLLPLEWRMSLLKIPAGQIEAMLTAASANPGWQGLAALDAAIRLVEALVKTKALEPGEQCGSLIFALAQANSGQQPAPNQPDDGPNFIIPKGYWSVSELEEPGPSDPQANAEPMLVLNGAVLIKVNGLRQQQPEGPDPLEELPEDQPDSAPQAAEEELAPELASILEEPRMNIEKTIWNTLREDGWLVPAIISGAFLVSALGVALQAFLLQGLFRFQFIFQSPEQRIYALAALFTFLVALFLLELPLSAANQRVGRRLETRLRIAFLQKIPLLSDRYFHSRLTSDMTARAHGLRSLRNLPGMAVGFLLSVFSMLMTVSGVIWLQPRSLEFALGAMLIFALFGWASHTILEESDLRMRTHGGALSRFYLDALQGLLPLRTHGAERAFRREHEGLLTEWMRSNSDMIKTGLGIQAISALLYALFSAWVGFDYIRGGGPAGGGLLLFYWTLNLPVHGQSIVGFIQQYPLMRNSLLRVLEPLEAPQENSPDQAPDLNPGHPPLNTPPGGVRIEMQHLDLVAGGHTILEGVNLSLRPGEHLAVVGPSGAGKSSLVGILLGWHTPAAGQCLVDGQPLLGQALIDLRRQTAWVDPAVQLWNKTLLENLTYGNNGGPTDSRGLRIEDADLYSLLQRLENGLQTMLGEGGGLVSGGEGQRVRLARAMNRSGVRLVVLDEPFRGLDRAQRRRLLHKAREYWKDATLICVTHDVGETLDFERVLVIENGHVIEDGAPAKLKRRRNSRYADLLKAEEQVRQGMWASSEWRHLRMDDGKLSEEV